MERYCMIFFLILIPSNLLNCFPRKEKRENIKIFIRKTGEAIAVDYLIHKYEMEHQKFYYEKIGNDACLVWPDLENKDLSLYCRNYLQHAVPSRTTNTATGSQIRGTLHYDKENTNVTSEIVIVRCKFMYKSHQVVYYMTRAPQPNCVYALKSAGHRSVYILNIIHKYCDFENHSSNNILKRKREEYIGTMHRTTGQPIAKDEYLLVYELEHQALVEMEGNERKRLGWTHVTSNRNLNSYCYQYMKQCAPNRNRDGLTAKWKTERLHYLKLITKGNTSVVVLHCQQGIIQKVNYHLTRAFEANCVYALLRQNGRKTDPLVIIFKHCDFEDLYYQNLFPQDCSTVGRNAIPKVEVKEEISN